MNHELTHEIKPTYVTFEQAKMLKEKGFDIPQNKMYSYSRPMFEHNKEVKFHNGDLHECSSTPYNWNDWSNRPTSAEYYSAPEQWQVVEWLRVKHGIWISVQIEEYRFDKMYYELTVNRINTAERYGFEHIKSLQNFNSPQHAYSAAFDHILKNII